MDFDVFEKLSELETKVYMLEKELEEKDIQIQKLTARNTELEKYCSTAGLIDNTEIRGQPPDLTGVGDGKSIADALKEASENAIRNSGYDFDERTGLYFHRASGYFYDPDHKLFFEPKTRTYLKYNAEKGEYDPQPHEMCSLRFKEFEALLCATVPAIPEENNENNPNSLESPPTPSRTYDSSGRSRRRKQRHYASERSRKRRKRQRSPHAEIEFLESPTSCHTSDKGALPSSPIEGNTEKLDAPPEITSAPVTYPPHIRLVVLSSEHTPQGTVFTLSSDECSRGWGCIGRNSDFCPSVNFPDDPAVDTIQCEVIYESDRQQYKIMDRESSPGTLLNGRSLEKTVPVLLNHGDILRIGSSCLLVHIHRGLDICEQCDPEAIRFALELIRIEQEPELAATDTLPSRPSRAELDVQRRATLEQLKAKYGIKLMNSTPASNLANDRAARRRTIEKKLKAAGISEVEPPKRKPPSDRRRSPSPKHDIPSLPAPPPIPTENRGAQMLSKMGWNPGQGLGKDSSGITEPISLTTRINSRAGFGAEDSKPKSDYYSRVQTLARERKL